MGFYVAAMAQSSLVDVYGISDEVHRLAAGGPQAVADGLQDAWVADLAVAGDPEECARGIQALLDAGSDSVVLFPVPPEDAPTIVETVAREILPQLGPG
jgi:alkanesulfonate monooxygenase SsuD/methylene tetrahydromethanopterin reductase-like flavin-dependent oxidoreductase (luciferase family)